MAALRNQDQVSNSVPPSIYGPFGNDFPKDQRKLTVIKEGHFLRMQEKHFHALMERGQNSISNSMIQ